MEIWKDVIGWEWLYEVSNLWNVFSIRKNKVLSKQKTIHWYLTVHLRHGISNRNKVIAVHRIVAFAFLTNSNKTHTVDHIDNNKENNCVDNLQWMSLWDNIRKAWADWLLKWRYTWEPKKWEKHPMAKFTMEDISNMRKLYMEWIKQTEIWKLYWISNTYVWDIVHYRHWK